MKKKLVEIIRDGGYVDICCPHCKKIIFSGFFMGITIYDLNGKCPYCKKEIIEEWKEKFKNEQ